jgi:hypothetical protein|tara:strand:+ start:841 stop:1251 length:411 start_codon:yes stop_codon:yes gene_type:complete
MGINKIHKLEQTLIRFLNFDGWDLKWTGKGYEHYDASGFTRKGVPCVIEMKFRNKYYEDKMLEKYKYDELMKMDKEIVKLYFVNDPKGNFLYWLNTLEMPKPVERYCPDTTLWTKKRILKPVYLLKENQATKINLN